MKRNHRKVFRMIVVCAIALLASEAFSIDKKQPATSSKTPSPESRAKAVPVAMKKEERVKTEKPKTGPISFRRPISKAANQQANELRLKAIGVINEQLKATKEQGRRYELLKRLGELYVEQFEYDQNIELDQFEAKFAAWEKGGRKGPMPVATYPKSQKDLANGIGVYQLLAKNYSQYPDMDTVYYELGKMQMSKDDPACLTQFNTVVTKFPKSELVPESYLMMGEYHFDKHKMVEAKQAYSMILKYKENTIYPFAVYKLGWTYYNYPSANAEDIDRNKRNSVAAFKEVVALASKRMGEQRMVQLKEEAVKDLVIVWADIEDVQDAFNYFRQIDSMDHFYQLLEKLGGIYTDQGKHKQAIQVYSRLLKEAPLRPGSPEVHKDLVALYDTENRLKTVVIELRHMQKAYLKGGAWYEKNKADPELLKKAEDTTELALRRYATTYHNDGMKNDDKRKMVAASALYMSYLEVFNKHPEAYELRFYYADLLLELKRYAQSAVQFMAVVKLDETKGKHREDGAFNAVLAQQAEVTRLKFPPLPKLGMVPTPLPLPAPKERLVTYLDYYVKNFPNREKSNAMRLTAAETLFNYGHYTNALARYNYIVASSPSTAQAKAAVKVVLAYHFDKRRWEDVIASARAFLVFDEIAKDSVGEYVQEKYRLASFNRAFAFEEAGKFKEAGESFRAYAKTFPKDDGAPKALYNSMLNFTKAKEIDESFESARVLLKEFPQFKQKIEVVVTLADTYEKIALFASAAYYYKMFAVTWPADKRAPESLYNAAVLYNGIGKYDEAAKLFSQYIRSYPNHSLIPDANFALAYVYKKMGRNPEFIAACRAYYTSYFRDHSEAAWTCRADAATVALTYDLDPKIYDEIARMEDALVRNPKLDAPLARKTISDVRFKTAELSFVKFRDIKFATLKDIQEKVGTKQAALQKMVSLYERVMKIASPEHVVASLYRLGEAQELFAQSLLGVEISSDVSDADAQTLMDQLTTQTQPLKQEALKFYSAALKKAEVLGSYSPWTKLAYVKASAFSPAENRSFQEAYEKPEFYGYQLSYDPEVTEAH